MLHYDLITFRMKGTAMTMRKTMLLGLSVLSAAFLRADSVWNWDVNDGGNGPDPSAATSWSLEENWSSGGVPNAVGAVADFRSLRTAGGGASVSRWISIPSEGITVGQVMFYVKNGAGGPMSYFLGGPVRFEADSGTTPSISRKSGGSSGCFWFAPVYAPGNLNCQACSFCEDLKVDGNFYITAGTVEFRFDRFAKDSSGIMIDTGPTNQVDVGTALTIYAPRGTGEACLWTGYSKGKGSPYAYRTSATWSTDLPIGAVVAHELYPSGTYLKHILSDTWIEMSQNRSVAGAKDAMRTMSCPAKEQICIQHIRTLRRRGGVSASNTGLLTLNKYREEDVFRVEVEDFKNQYGGDVFTLNADEGLYPGTLVLRKTTDYTAVLECQRAHLEFPEQQPDFTGIKRLSVKDGNSLRVTVSNDVAAVFETVTNLAGTVVKDGSGLLLLGNLEDGPAKSVAVNEGAIAFASGVPIREIESLSLSAGSGVGAIVSSSGLGSAAVEISTELNQSDDNVVFVSGDLDHAKMGTYEILKSTSIVAADSAKWRCVTSATSKRRVFDVVVEDGRVLLSVKNKRGLVIFFW